MAKPHIFIVLIMLHCLYSMPGGFNADFYIQPLRWHNRENIL